MPVWGQLKPGCLLNRGGGGGTRQNNIFIVEPYKITNTETSDMARWVKLLAAKPGNLSLIPGRQGEHCGGTDQTSVSSPLTSLLTVKHTGPQAQTHK